MLAMHFNFPRGYIHWHYEKSLIYEAPGQSWVLVLKMLHLSWLFFQQLKNKMFWCLGLCFLVSFVCFVFFLTWPPYEQQDRNSSCKERWCMAQISSCEIIWEKTNKCRGKSVSSLWLPVAGPGMKHGCCSLRSFSSKLLGLGVVWFLFCFFVWGLLVDFLGCFFV